MEHAQRGFFYSIHITSNCLNPYFNGTCSKRSRIYPYNKTKGEVLILILMEHAQRDYETIRVHAEV